METPKPHEPERDSETLKDLLAHETNPFHVVYPTKAKRITSYSAPYMDRSTEKAMKSFNERNLRKAIDREFMLEELNQDNHFIGTIKDRWALATGASGYSAEYVVIFRLPEGGVRQGGLQDFKNPTMVPDGKLFLLNSLDDHEKEEFIRMGEFLVDHLTERNPQAHYVFGVNRSILQSDPTKVGGQTLPILHGHVFAMPEVEPQPFNELYDSKTENELNKGLLKLRISPKMLEFNKRLVEKLEATAKFLNKGSDLDKPVLTLTNDGRVIDLHFNLEGIPDRAKYWYLTFPAMDAEDVFRELGSGIDTYSWTLDSQDNMKITFTSLGGGLIELHNGAVDRITDTPPADYIQKRDDFRNTIKGWLPELEAAADQATNE